jgi:NAD(P)-dependent dehydrogenase (short-subunit alcohol dehydrogenase family)
MELGKYNIRVNALCPGSVEGPRIDGVIERDAQARGIQAEQVRSTYQLQSSMRLFVSAEDVANMVIFLASSLGKHMSGQAIGIDGNTESLSTHF